MPISAPAAGDGPAAAGRGRAAADDARATATSSPSLSSCRRSTASRQLDLRPRRRASTVGRIQNFGSWSPYLVKDGRTCLGLEYFVNEGDELWTQVRRRPRSSRASASSREFGLVDAADRSRPATSCGCRRRTRCTTSTTQANVDVDARVARRAHRQRVPGRAATACTSYNNQDHSMYTAMLAVENIFGARPRRLVGERRGRVPRGEAQLNRFRWSRRGRCDGFIVRVVYQRAGRHARRSAIKGTYHRLATVGYGSRIHQTRLGLGQARADRRVLRTCSCWGPVVARAGGTGVVAQKTHRRPRLVDDRRRV